MKGILQVHVQGRWKFDLNIIIIIIIIIIILFH